MMNNYKKLFEQISPRESDEVLISKLMARKAENMKDNDTKKSKKIFLKKAVAIPAAAVLAIGAATVTVGATNDWDYAKAFSGYFAQINEDNVSVEYTLENPIETFNYEKYGKKLGIVLNGDGLTATLDGIIVYNDSCYISCTVTASDEFLAKSNGYVPALTTDFSKQDNVKIDGEVVDGKKRFRVEAHPEGTNTVIELIQITFDSVPLGGKTLNIDFFAEANLDGVNTVVLNEHKDIPIDLIYSNNIEKNLSLKLKTKSFDGEINKIMVSGFRANLCYSGSISSFWVRDAVFDEISAFGNAVIILKDGTSISAEIESLTHCRKGTEITGGEINLRYTYPINPEDVSTIKFGDYTINL